MSAPEQDPMVVGIAQIIDHPSVYMGGPSRNSLRIAEAIVKEFGSDLCASGQQVRALEWRSAGYDGQTLEASALGLEVFYRVHGKPGDWTLTSPGAREYVHTPGYETRADAQAAAQADYERRVLAALTPAPQPSAATPTAQEAEPVACLHGYCDAENCPACSQDVQDVAQEAVPACAACEDNPKPPNIPCAVCGAHPPQPSETVAEAAMVLINAYSRDDNLGRTLVRLAGEAQKYSPAAEAFLLEVSALRALKGEGQ